MTAPSGVAGVDTGPLTVENAGVLAARIHALLAGGLFAVAEVHSGVSPLHAFTARLARLDVALEARGTAVRAEVGEGAIWLCIETTDRVYAISAGPATWLSFDDDGLTVRHALAGGRIVYWRFAPTRSPL